MMQWTLMGILISWIYLIVSIFFVLFDDCICNGFNAKGQFYDKEKISLFSQWI